MDVDGSSVPPSSGDIDQNLLLQFSCMNTTDRDELISQLQKVLGPSVNYNTASFFLEMNSWNLQAAVCSYLDYYTPPKPSMALKEAQTHEVPLAPGVRFEQSWHIANTGLESWPGSCQIVQVGGEPFGGTSVYVPPLPPGHSITVTVLLTTPNSPGKHRGYFNLLTPRQEKYGDTLWVEVIVDAENTMAIVEKMASLPVPSSSSNQATTSQFTQLPPPDDQMC